MVDHNPYDPPKSAVSDIPQSTATIAPVRRALRWILILPAAIGAWFLALFIGILTLMGVESICRQQEGGAGQCGQVVESAVIAFGAALAATLILISCTWLAPTHKRQVAIATFVAGSIVAIMMGLGGTDTHVPMVAAIVTGAIVLAIILRRYAPLTPAHRAVRRARDGSN